MKTCSKCGAEKPIDEFYQHNRMADGRINECKTCVRARTKSHRAENSDYYRAYERERNAMGRSAETVGKGWMSKWTPEERRHAQSAVQQAVIYGKLEALPCERCGYGIGVHAHHEDYSKPLDVNWLCRRCHGVRHREINAERRKRSA